MSTPAFSDVALLTVPEAAQILGVKPATIRQWITRGKLDPITIDGHRYVTERAAITCERDTRRSARGRQRQHMFAAC